MHKKLAAILLCALTSCDPPQIAQVTPVKPNTYHNVPYYDANLLARSQTLAWCSENSGLEAREPDCDNAATSRRHQWHREMGWN